jgi:hypothetical protein
MHALLLRPTTKLAMQVWLCKCVLLGNSTATVQQSAQLLERTKHIGAQGA